MSLVDLNCIGPKEWGKSLSWDSIFYHRAQVLLWSIIGNSPQKGGVLIIRIKDLSPMIEYVCRPGKDEQSTKNLGHPVVHMAVANGCHYKICSRLGGSACDKQASPLGVSDKIERWRPFFIMALRRCYFNCEWWRILPEYFSDTQNPDTLVSTPGVEII